MHNDPEFVNIAAHWKVFDQPGAAIDGIERKLSIITDAQVERTETMNNAGNYDAVFTVKGKIDVRELKEACYFMRGIKAYPI